jgi:hypothetical protein
MTKVSRREAISLLLCVSGSLPGCVSQGARYIGPKTPDLPEDCVWVELPYSFVCLYGEFNGTGGYIGSLPTTREHRVEVARRVLSSLRSQGDGSPQ